jgi:hypothetical protein
MKRAFFTLPLLIVFSLYFFAYAQDREYGIIVGNRKYFVEDPARGGGRDYIVRNPRATLPVPSDIPLAKTDSTPQECFGWTEDQRITFSELTSYSPRVAVSGDTIHVVWEEWRDVFYKRSVNGGITWEDTILISQNDEITSQGPDVAVCNQNVYVVWEYFCSISQNCGIYFRKSTDAGENWLPIQPLALAGPDYYEYYRPTMVAKDSSVFVAFAKNVDSDGMVKFKKSSDCGETWSQEIHISDRSVQGHWAKLVLNSMSLYVAYQNGFRIWCNKSTNWGDNWSDDIFISDMDSSLAQWPSIGADDNGGVYISWFDYKYSPYPWTGDIFLRRSTDNGETWDSIIAVTNNHLCIESDVCADTSSAHVVWHDERHNMGNGNVEIYHRKSTNVGAIWSDETRLTNAPYQSGDPRITKDNSKLYMVWIDNRNEPDPQAIYFKKGLWYYPGDGNGDKIINTADVVYLINFLFVSGPEPNIFKAGDANGDRQINSADVVYLINYLFIGGPSPVDC